MQPLPVPLGAVLVMVVLSVVTALGADDTLQINNPLGFATSITNANNGDLLLMRGERMVRVSDGGRTVGEPVEMPIGVSGVTRLDENHLIARSGRTFHVSPDDGATWEKRGQIDEASAKGGEGEFPGWIGLGVPNYDVLLKASDGRLFLPVRGSAAASRLLASQSAAQGIFRGQRANIEGHAHRPEADYSFAWFSDDEGRTWRKSHGSILIWKDDGFGGMWPADEPCMVELGNGDLMMFFRTTLGRIYTSRSGPVDTVMRGGPWRPDARTPVKAPAGAYWDNPQPTPLAAAYTPCRVRRIPSTGDLLIVWNQVSGDEIRGSYSRCRMSSAVSSDDGVTWQHFRTIDRSVLPPAGRIEPDEPAMARAIAWVGEVPDDWGHLDYPNIGFFGDKVVVSWTRAVPRPLPGQPQGARLLIAPVAWLYGDEKPYVSPPGSPKLIVGEPGTPIPAVWLEDRFLVNLTDVATAVGLDPGAVPRNMFGTLHQMLTCLELEGVYDRSGMDDLENPVLRVTVRR